MAVTTSYCHSNLVPMANISLLGKTLWFGRNNKTLCLGIKQADFKLNRCFCSVQITGRKMGLRASAKGSRDSDSEDSEYMNGDENENDDESEDDDENVSFWERKETRDKMKDLEDMRDLIKEAEKLQEGEGRAETPSIEESEEERKIRLREELAKRAKELAKRRKEAEVMFQMGQRAYGKGMYGKAVELLEGALTNVSKVSLFGGEIQLWLAMAYDAHNRHGDCISLYKSLEKTHPFAGIRKKAAGLRYILEAPKLKITEDEMVTIPLLNSNYDSSKSSRGQMYVNRKKKTAVNKETIPTRDYFSDFLVWNPPQWERSPYFWVGVAMWLTLVGVALVFQD